MNIGLIIDGDELVEFLQDSCPFKVIESEYYGNIFYENLDTSKIQHVNTNSYYLKL